MPSEIVRSDFVWDNIVIVGFRVYYGNGIFLPGDDNTPPSFTPPTVITSEGVDSDLWEDLWLSAPDTDVQIVNIYYNRVVTKQFERRSEGGAVNIEYRPRRIHDLVQGWDWFWFQPPPLKVFGRATDLLSVPPGALAKQGRLIDGDLWTAIYSMAYEDWVFEP